MYCSYWEMVNLSLLISFLLVLVKNFCLHSQDTKSAVGSTARKTIFSFSRRPEKMVFPKILRWNMIFLALSRKMMFLFLENMILSPGPKMKDYLSQGIHGNMIFSVYTYRRYKDNTVSLCQNKSKIILPSKDISKSDWHSRLTP